MTPSVSVVVNTLNRADSLRRTLRSLLQLDYPEIELVVVVGPSTDYTDAVLTEFAGQIKVGRCEEPNLSTSRNVGLRLAGGELVAFIDDDSVPEPWWLDEVVPAFENPEVAAAGGPVYDFDGVTVFSRYSLVDVHGDTVIGTDGRNLSRLLSAPLSETVVYPIGTNAVFRRSVLVDLGGFDEEYGHYFDDADIGRRLADNGWLVQASEGGFVYHLRLPSASRTSARVTRDLYPYLRSRAYFAFRHGQPRAGLVEVSRRYQACVGRYRQDRIWCIENGLLAPEDLESFESAASRAIDDAFESADNAPKLRAPAWFAERDAYFLRPQRRRPDRRLHMCIVSQEYLPKQLNGIGRFSYELGVALAERGHVVRIITEADGGASVAFEHDVWVHRVVPSPEFAPPDIDAPERILGFSAGALAELRRIDDGHAVDVVEVPNWNSEGIAILEDGAFTTVLGLHTPLATIARMDSRIGPDALETAQLLALERRCYDLANAFVAWGQSSLAQVEEEYGITLARDRVGFIPHGISNRGTVNVLRSNRDLNVLFVGRLEARKGIDTLLEAIALLLPELPGVTFTIAGNDAIPSETGRTYRERFELATDAVLREGRVLFRGVVSDDELDRLYANCDMLVAPSRHESFGLILLEAMREGKPVVAADVGGMREVVEHERNGLLVRPADARALARAVKALAESPEQREAYGRRSRELFEERFTAARMAVGHERFCTSLLEATVVC